MRLPLSKSQIRKEARRRSFAPPPGSSFDYKMLSERSFFSGSLLLPLPSAKFHPPEKPKTGKLRLFSEFHKHISDLHVLVA